MTDASSPSRIPSPGALLDEPKIDCHVHVLDPARFPYGDTAYRPIAAETGTADQLGHVMAANGVRHALLVGPNSGYGLDNRCMLDALARGQGRFKGVAVVRNDASVEELQALQAAGVVGIAFNIALLGTDFYRGTEPLLQKLRELDLWAQIQVEGDQLPEVRPMLEASGAKLLFDHTGRPRLANGTGQPGFEALLAMAGNCRTCVKLSGYAKFSEHPYPHADALPYFRALVEAYTPQSLVWASDWPFLRAPSRIDYGPLVALLARWLPDAEARRAIWWDTPRRLFGFGDEAATSPA